MQYIKHYKMLMKYQLAEVLYDNILTEQEELFQRTQPKAIDYDKERVAGGQPSNAYDEYIIAKEKKRLDERLKTAKKLLDQRRYLLDMAENDLLNSKDWYDIIYRLYYIRKLSVKQIERQLPYSRRQIYRIIDEIKQNFKAG